MQAPAEWTPAQAPCRAILLRWKMTRAGMPFPVGAAWRKPSHRQNHAGQEDLRTRSVAAE